MAVTKAQVAQLYVALFNRAPEGAGLNAWVNASVSRDQAQTADAMLQSPAVQAYFNGRIDTNRGYIENIYKNILGKDYSQDPDGINAWVRHLELGHSRGETLIKLFEVAQSPEAKAAAPVAAKIFENKTAISAYMAEKVAEIENDGSVNYDYTPFQEIIASTNDTNLDAQKAKIDRLVQEKLSNRTLTTEIDNITGTDGDDTFNANYYAGEGTKVSTLSPFDKVDGGNGKDTFNLTVFKNTGSGSSNLDLSELDNAFKGVKNVENLNINSEVKFSGAVTFDQGFDNLNITTVGQVKVTTNTKEKVSIDTNNEVVLAAAEAKEIAVKAGTPTTPPVTTPPTPIQNTKIDAAKATKASIDLTSKTNTLHSASVLTEVADLSLANLKLAGDLTVAKAKTINVKNVDFGTNKVITNVEDVDFTMSYKEEGVATLSSAAATNVKTLALHAHGDKKSEFKFDTITSLTKATIDGDAKDLTIKLTAQTGLTNVDASKFIGNFAKISVGNVLNSNVVLGSGDDTVEVDNVTQKQTIDGGAGVDLLAITSSLAASATNDLTLKNFEGLKITDPLSGAIDMSKWSGFDNLTLGDGVNSGIQSITNVLNNSTITLEKTEIANTKGLIIGVKDAATGTADKINLVFNPTVTTSGLNNAGTIQIDDIENLDIVSNADTAKTTGVKNIANFKATAASKGTLTNVVVKGDADTEIKFDANFTKMKTVDASALTGKFTFDGATHLDDKAVVKGGTADDTITFASTMATTVTGGAGKDTFVINKGIDPVTFAASKTSTITDFTKGDTIKIGGLAATTQDKIVKYEVSGSLDFANNFKEALKAAGDKKVAYFTYRDPDANSTDTYVVKSHGDDAVADEHDYIVKLSGAIDLSNATITTSGNDTLITL